MKRYIKESPHHGFAIFTECSSEKCLEQVVLKYKSAGNFKISFKPCYGFLDLKVIYLAELCYPFLDTAILTQETNEFQKFSISLMGHDKQKLSNVIDDIVKVCYLTEIGMTDEQAKQIEKELNSAEAEVKRTFKLLYELIPRLHIPWGG